MSNDGARMGSERARIRNALLLSILLFLPAAPSPAASVVLQINATSTGMPSSNLLVKSMLPAGVGPRDIVDTAGLSVGYDVKDAMYYVHGETSLAPGEVKRFNVVLRDIWTIPEADLDALELQVCSLTEPLCTIKDNGATAALADETIGIIREIRTNQAANAVSAVTTEKHIGAYQLNRDRLRAVKRNLYTMENAAMGAGFQLAQVLGEFESGPVPAATSTEKRAVIRISIKNKSPNYGRNLSLRELLPRELTAGDILDAGGLLVGLDLQQNRLFVQKNELIMSPGETQTYNLIVRDRWDVNALQFDRLEAAAARLQLQFSKSKNSKVIMREIKALMQSIAKLRKVPPPTTVDDNYAAFFRDQANKLRTLELQVARIQALPSGRKAAGTMTQAPERHTTWLIIYGILVFLGVLTAAMFLLYSRPAYTQQAGPRMHSRNTAAPTAGSSPPPTQSTG